MTKAWQNPYPLALMFWLTGKFYVHCHIQSGLTYVLKNVGSCNSTLQPKISYTVNLAFLTFFSNFLNQSFEFSTQPLSIEQTLPIANGRFFSGPQF